MSSKRPHRVASDLIEQSRAARAVLSDDPKEKMAAFMAIFHPHRVHRRSRLARDTRSDAKEGK
jgi:hypothetical protein